MENSPPKTPLSTDTTFQILPVEDVIIAGNSSPHNPAANNPLRDSVSKPIPVGR